MICRINLRPVTVLALLMVWLALPLSGCGGCSRTPVDDKQAQDDLLKKKLEEEKKKKEKPKPDFELSDLQAQPADPEKPAAGMKPGHWATVTRRAIANNFDFVGSLEADVTTSVDSRIEPLPLVGQPYQLRSERGVVLTKGHEKYLDQTIFVPRAEHALRVDDVLSTRGGSVVFGQGQEHPFNRMPAYQYYFVVVAREPSRYQLFARKDPLVGPSLLGRYYSVQAPHVDKYVPLPSNPLAWTSTAYVLWDDVDASTLSAEQRRAMIDWLHWGGQLIISGPDTLALLHGSAFDEFLPANPGKARGLTEQDFAPLVAAIQPTDGKRTISPVVPTKSWVGVTLQLRPNGHWLPNERAKLIAECSVGRGRVVVTAFRLSQRDLLHWDGFDTLLNSCLLRHPARQYKEVPNSLDRMWVPQWAGDGKNRFDPRITCGLRYLSRDLSETGQFEPAPNPSNSEPTSDEQQTVQSTTAVVYPGSKSASYQPADSFEPDEEDFAGSGLGGWSDFNAVPSAARESLRASAGITIPNANFVAWMLVAYLAVLGPVNWAVFSMLGRIEWAWVAAPILAIAGAVVVTKAAHLNIGFARSQTEIDVVELQPDYSRAHLTRYTALYTSLSTSYEARFDDPHALIQPFALGGTSRIRQTERTVTLHRDADARLSDFDVSSNSTAMLHSEQMIDFGGGIGCSISPGRVQVHNRSKYGLKRAGVVRRAADGEFEAAWLGDFPTGSDRELNFQPVRKGASPLAQYMRRDPSDAGLSSSAEEATIRLNVAQLATTVTNAESIAAGEMRLIGQMDELLPGMEVTPQSSQATRAGVLVVANLQYPPPPAVQPDVNLPPPNTSLSPMQDPEVDSDPSQ